MIYKYVMYTSCVFAHYYGHAYYDNVVHSLSSKVSTKLIIVHSKCRWTCMYLCMLCTYV